MIFNKYTQLAIAICDNFLFAHATNLMAPIDGFTHNVCIEFSGDSTDWVPQYKSKKQVTSLSEKTLVFEL